MKERILILDRLNAVKEDKNDRGHRAILELSRELDISETDTYLAIKALLADGVVACTDMGLWYAK